jgi:ERCC4-type nuclease
MQTKPVRNCEKCTFFRTDSSMLIVDVRERHLIEEFEEKPEVRVLDLGDIVVDVDGVSAWTIERKTLEDLAASIKDGRHREQKGRLMSTNGTMGVIAYLIEGFPKPYQQYINGIRVETLESAIANTIVRDRILVFRTPNIRESVKFLRQLNVKTIEFKDKTLPSAEDVQKMHVESLIKSKKGDNKDSATCYLAQLCQIPGVSCKTARAVRRKYSSMHSLSTAFQQSETPETMLRDAELSEGEGKRRRIGPAVAARMYGFFLGK